MDSLLKISTSVTEMNHPPVVCNGRTDGAQVWPEALSGVVVYCQDLDMLLALVNEGM